MFVAVIGISVAERIDNLNHEKRWVPMDNTHNADSTMYDPVSQTKKSSPEVPMGPLVYTPNVASVTFGDMLAKLFVSGDPHSPSAVRQTEKRWVPMEFTPNSESSSFDDMLANMYASGNPFDSTPMWQTEISQPEVPIEPLVYTPNDDSFQFGDMLANLFANSRAGIPRVKRGIKSFEFPNGFGQL